MDIILLTKAQNNFLNMIKDFQDKPYKISENLKSRAMLTKLLNMNLLFRDNLKMGNYFAFEDDYYKKIKIKVRDSK